MYASDTYTDNTQSHTSTFSIYEARAFVSVPLSFVFHTHPTLKRSHTLTLVARQKYNDIIIIHLF